VFIDGSFMKHKISVKLIFITALHNLNRLNSAVSCKAAAWLVLIPCFLDSNAIQTIPKKYSKNRNSDFPIMGCVELWRMEGAAAMSMR
jgi:hypothetical protein